MANDIKASLFQHECEGTVRTLARNHDAMVAFRGEEAGTNGNTIILPSIPEEAKLTDRQARVGRGFVDHEAAHQRYTEMDLMEKVVEDCKKHDDMKVPKLLNAIEDVRIERETCRDYPGSKKNLEATADCVTDHFLKEVLPNQDEGLMDDRDAIMAIALTWEGRRRMGYKSEAIDEAMSKVGEKLRKEVEVWAQEILDNCKSTRDAYKIAQAISLSKEEWEDQPDDPGDRPEEGEGEGEGEDPGEGEDGGEGDDGEGKKPKRGSAGIGAGKPERDMLDEHDIKGEALKAEWANPMQAKAGYRPYDTSQDKLHTRHDARDKYTFTESDGGVRAPTGFNIGHNKIAKGKADDYERIRSELSSTVNVMKNKFQRCLMDMAKRDWDSGKEHGYLDSRRLVMAVRGEPNVFRMRQDEPEMDTAVMVHIDLSGSMSGRKVVLAQQTAIAIAEMIGGSVPFAVTGFSDEQHFDSRAQEEAVMELYHEDGRRPGGPKYDRYFPIDRYIFKSFDESLREARGPMASIRNCVGGNNCDGEHVLWAGRQLLARPEKKKVLFVLSDGYPAYHCHTDENSHITNVVAQLQEVPGFTVIGIGMLSDAVRRFYDKHEVVNRIEELPRVVMGQMGKVLLGERVELDNSKLMKRAGRVRL
jgi:cobaltochelatase CobT